MTRRIIAIGFVFCCCTLAWILLGGTVTFRTHRQDARLRDAVGQLWGTSQIQRAPLLYWTESESAHTPAAYLRETENPEERNFLPLLSSRIDVDLQLDHRRKGLLWYSTYRVDFDAAYRVENSTPEPRRLIFDFPLPSSQAVYDGFTLAVGDTEVPAPTILSGRLLHALQLQPGQSQTLRLSYRSQGLDEWRYRFGNQTEKVDDFQLTVHTDFDRIDFPRQTISPLQEETTATGWKLIWRYDRLLTGADLGLALPQKLNPGPWVSQVCFAAPISLFLFFFLLFLITTIGEIRLHPMHYFFIGAAFFSFHLLLAYLVDHLSIHASFAICSLVSLFLVVSYVRLVVGLRFALIRVGLAQVIYQVLFSCTFFFPGYTGLAITALSIVTLFAAMQFTGRVDWENLFRRDCANTP
ncbi:MAG: hypothetical protein HOC74_08270 [Gemmatimonadetes bacterium]|jgi:hypothetical protein|nr:hypothetical protein [Gemmatimonadota bacterium]